MADDYYKKGFKEMLKQYFFNNINVQGTYPTIDPKDLNQENPEHFKELSDTSKIARERAFNRFFIRIQNEPILDANGKPYPTNNGLVDLDKVAYDFYLGKPVVFKGYDPDGMIKVSTEKEKNTAYRQALVKAQDKFYVDPDNPAQKLDILSYNYNPATDIKDKYPDDVAANPESITRPKKLGWWNNIVKFFTGHSCKSWEKYDKAQELLASKNAIDTATAHAASQKGVILSEEEVKTDYQKARIKILQNNGVSKEQATVQVEGNDVDVRKDVTQTIMDNYTYNKDTKKFELKSAMEQKKAREARTAEKQKNVAEKEKVQEKEKEVKKEDPKPEIKQAAPKAPEKPLKDDPYASARKSGGKYFRENMLGDYFGGTKNTLYEDNVGNHKQMVATVEKAYKRLEEFADPNMESNMTKDQLADDLATVYLGYEMHKNIKGMPGRRIREDENPETIGDEYRTALEGLQGKHDLHKTIKKAYLDNIITQDAMDNPEHLLGYVLGGEEGMKKFGDATNQIVMKDKNKNIIDEKSAELLEAQMTKEKALQNNAPQIGM